MNLILSSCIFTSGDYGLLYNLVKSFKSQLVNLTTCYITKSCILLPSNSWNSVHKTILQSAECIFLKVEIATYDPRNSQKWYIITVPADGCEITVFGLNKRCSEKRPLVLDIVQMTSSYSSNLILWNQICKYSHHFVTVSWHRCMRSSYILLLKFYQ